MSCEVIRQHDQRDCGAACLAMIARHHGVDYPLSQFRAITNTNRSGVNLYGLVTGAKAIGLAAEALTGTHEDLLSAIESGHVKLPFIAHIHKMAVLHFVVVCEYSERVLTIADPASGLRRLTLEEFNKLWTGFVVSISIDPLNEPPTHRPASSRKPRSAL